MTKDYVLAIDQGGQSSRVAIYSGSGTQLHCFSSPCVTTHCYVDNVEFIEQDPLDVLDGIKRCLHKVEKILGDDVGNIVAAGFAGQGSSLLCWDNQSGEALSPVISWQDIRGERYLENISLTHKQSQKITGLRVSPHYGASKICWCLDNNAQVIRAHENSRLNIGPIVSYILWHLCGTNVVDPGHAQRTLLWNLQKNNWDESLLALFDIPLTVLPECKYHNSYFGELRLNNTNIPLAASARDQGASLFARGIPDKNNCYINIGTGAFIQRVGDSLSPPDGLLVSPLWIPDKKIPQDFTSTSPIYYPGEFDKTRQIPLSSEKNLYAWEATVNGAASAIEFIEQQSGLTITPEQIIKALSLAPTHDCYFLNAVGGLSAPYWRTDLQSRFSENLSPEEKILAWLESIIFQIAVNVNAMDSPDKIQKIFISGGFSNADPICQKLADLVGVPVYRSENTDATLQGIACMAAGFPDSWNRSPRDDIFLPRPNPTLLKNAAVWHNAVVEWLNV